MPRRKSSPKNQQSSALDEQAESLAELGLNQGGLSEEEFAELIAPEQPLTNRHLRK